MSNPDVEVEQDTLELHTDAALEWRRAQYEEMGFSAQEALVLARSTQVEWTGAGTEKDPKKQWNPPLDWKKVKKALDAGCTPAQALEIFVS